MYSNIGLELIVTESYKIIGLSSYKKLINLFENILYNNPTTLEIRCVLATVVHPDLLISEEQLDFSQKILEVSFNYYLYFDIEKFSKEEKLILKKGSSLAPSVIVNKNPYTGFPYFERLIEKIIKTKLKKKRLENNYPNKVEALLLEIKN